MKLLTKILENVKKISPVLWVIFLMFPGVAVSADLYSRVCLAPMNVGVASGEIGSETLLTVPKIRGKGVLNVLNRSEWVQHLQHKYYRGLDLFSDPKDQDSKGSLYGPSGSRGKGMPMETFLELRVMSYYPNRIRLSAKLGEFGLLAFKALKQHKVSHGQFNMSHVRIHGFEMNQDGEINWDNLTLSLAGFEHSRIQGNRDSGIRLKEDDSDFSVVSADFGRMQEIIKMLLNDGSDNELYKNIQFILEYTLKTESLPLAQALSKIEIIKDNILQEYFEKKFKKTIAMSVGNGNRYGTLGQGGMGLVSAVDFNGLKAVKFLNPFLVKGPPESSAAFYREVQFLERLRGKGPFPMIYEVAGNSMNRTEEGIPYYVMDYLAGQSLHDILEEYDLTQVARYQLAKIIATYVASAIDVMSKEGIIHRDLKPDNIMLGNFSLNEQGLVANFDQVRPVIIDFGVAREAGYEDVNGMISGTPAYMAPEMGIGTAASITSDLYALSVILSQVLSEDGGIIARYNDKGDFASHILYKKQLNQWQDFKRELSLIGVNDPHDRLAYFFYRTMSGDIKVRVQDPAEYLRLFLQTGASVIGPGFAENATLIDFSGYAPVRAPAYIVPREKGFHVDSGLKQRTPQKRAA